MYNSFSKSLLSLKVFKIFDKIKLCVICHFNGAKMNPNTVFPLTIAPGAQTYFLRGSTFRNFIMPVFAAIFL